MTVPDLLAYLTMGMGTSTMGQVLLECLAAGVGTAAFAVLFQVPGCYYLHCGIIGGGGWLCYRLLCFAGLTVMPATFFANVVVVFLSRWSAVHRRCPVTVFLIPGIFPLVPGAGIYWAAYYLVVNEPDKAAARGAITLKVAVAIVLSILLIFELPQGVFRVLNPTKKLDGVKKYRLWRKHK